MKPTYLTAGSVCTGAAMLDRAVEAVLGPLDWAWHAETDPAASAVLEHHYPDVTNHGDITEIDWTRVEPVHVLCAGYPCQGFSLAGRRLGEDDERFIWPYVFAAVRDLRPRFVLLENVPGHLSLGFGRVLGDLASIGYDARWMCLRASDIGAPHRRNRVFIAAWPAEADGAAVRAPAVAEPRRGHTTVIEHPVLLKTPTAQLAINGGSQHPDKRKAGGHGPTLADQVEHLLPTPTAQYDGRNATATRTAPKPTTTTTGWTLNDVAYADRWGQYAPAIARWEAVLGVPAPAPTEPGKNGPRLAAPFVEFLMGLPAGWVTDHVGRNDALRILGNGVVWQQAAAAYTTLGVSRSAGAS